MPIVFAFFMLNCIYIQYMVEVENADFEKSLHSLLDMRQTLMLLYIAMSIMTSYNMKHVVFTYSPIFLVGMVYFDQR